ncbi:MAG: Holliday junction ATP-dependent DNA helicase RuvA [Parcubacteria group bacterium GW2011_GWA2_43_9b]|uniref:Holliday junction branch migration complex subunit RuvA n=1 Tax=Candidatus Portnoybacteria bacterium RIFCSPLOWO2_02_FULL_39_11 TaxID=1802001 RepID=A0A1G2FWF7_9BACT|nr:MAG: Holliday junction ATP-dependent DNA helicase RuvA [Parcubacteria group bacterium GW2011_GWA2_43_9b]OGZ42393.1 MAG: Holliday junction DNA helicase RuvA [Candidatus Portnoybacteria bacterium RIFCSPLOWO2_02_FULL_39_11]
MISSLEGKISLRAEKHIILEANGIGYKVWCGEKTFSKLPQPGAPVKLFTYLSVKETGWDLFGFLSFEELEMFELLITISGIGPKTAAGILSAATVEDLQEAIVLGDETILARVSGIGSKVAMKIVIELKSKVKKLAKGTGDKFKVADDIEIIDALVVLGYKVYEAREALKQVPESVKGMENRVREALKRLGKK